jgi:hypothetical protein
MDTLPAIAVILMSVLGVVIVANAAGQRADFKRERELLLKMLADKDHALYKLAMLCKAATATEAAGIEASTQPPVFTGTTLVERDELAIAEAKAERQAMEEFLQERESI